MYRIAEKPPQQRDGVVFFSSEYVDELEQSSYSLKIVDDKNLPGTTLGRRRLQLRETEQVRLHPLRTAIYLLADLIKLAKASTWFIDSSGRVFQYKKHTRAKLTTKKIKQVLPAQGIGCVLEIEGLAQRFKVMIRPKTEQYAVVLQLGLVHILYGLSDTPRPPSWRLV